ncbi:hypothetical protein [Methylorubrum extorquens]|jgi:hypothetical protein|uniref:hypothetical protein n=1 Tax=Methylorubrum extorquens TaxID=408 RepID=UPI001EE556E1|nr:hypothetical protein [Methylorubrum extorquens]
MPDATHTSPMALVVDEDDTAPGSALAPTLEVAAARTKLPESGLSAAVGMSDPAAASAATLRKPQTLR